MALDEALLASAIETGSPTLRFYCWSGPWLSLGYRQRLDVEHLAACTGAGVGVVRRTTGGRAVLHGEDLTYAVVAREETLPAGLAATYAFVAEVLQQALAALGVVAEPAPRRAAARRGEAFDCFAEPAADELCAGGRKLIGSAQRRAGGGVLQHGSIRLGPDRSEVRQAAGFEPGVATSLSELGVDFGVESLISACCEAFGQRLGAGLEPGVLSPVELEDARDRQAARTLRIPVSIGDAPRGASRVQLDDR
jgi:lipoate-protein ligase A